jgi:hypothetical protein
MRIVAETEAGDDLLRLRAEAEDPDRPVAALRA